MINIVRGCAILILSLGIVGIESVASGRALKALPWEARRAGHPRAAVPPQTAHQHIKITPSEVNTALKERLEELNKLIYDIINTRKHRIYQLGGSKEISYYQLAKNYFSKHLPLKSKIIPLKLEDKNSYLLSNIKLKSFIP